jgi:capsule polysaccharide modification protein KpsS
MLPDLGCSHALLLQGPAGPFFRRFATELRAEGIRVTKVNLHGGDVLYFPGPGAVAYRGDFDEWPAFVRELIRSRGIDGLFVFGDCRPYHRAAIDVARELGVKVWVFEEGYLRPNHITLEENGVNGYSSLSRDPDFYRRCEPSPPEPAVPVGATWPAAAWWSMWNAFAFSLGKPAFPHYEHHRTLDFTKHVRWHARDGLRKLWLGYRERGLLERVVREIGGRYFFVPLQVHCDFQLYHSPYDHIRDFIRELVSTFAQHARPQHHLVLKHHPLDRAYCDHGDFLKDLAHECGLTDRLWYVHDLHLPTLLRHARGTITINSTVGLSSVFYNTPVKVTGTAVYDMPGLTFQGALEHFLREPGAPDSELYAAFRHYLERTNQINGSVWKRLPGYCSGTGVRWHTIAENKS